MTELEQAIAEILDYPSVFMGGPSRLSLRKAEAIVAMLNERIATRQLVPAQVWQPTHCHVKRGTEYKEVARGKLQTDVPLSDYAPLVAYHDADGNWWFRDQSEFDDGRFVPAAPTEGGV